MNDPDLMGHHLWDTLDHIESAGLRTDVIRIGERAEIPRALRFAILARDRFACQWCGRSKPLQLDHIVSWSAGGLDVSTNLRALCDICNESRSNYRTDMGSVKVLPVTFGCIQCDLQEGDLTSVFCVICDRPTRASIDAVSESLDLDWWSSRWPADIGWLTWTTRVEMARRERRELIANGGWR